VMNPCQIIPDQSGAEAINALAEHGASYSPGTRNNARSSRIFSLRNNIIPYGGHSILRQRLINEFRKKFYSKLMTEVQDLPNECCRICREAESKERLLSPCHCKGTMAFVHLSCLQRWLLEADSCSCELCGKQYVVIRTPRYGLLQSMYVWAKHHSSNSLWFDTIAFLAFMPFAILGTYTGIKSAEIYDELESSGRNDMSTFGRRLLAMGVVYYHDSYRPHVPQLVSVTDALLHYFVVFLVEEKI
ncbi:hypothetical protein L9F63_025649, partial [Diploptera punctata]